LWHVFVVAHEFGGVAGHFIIAFFIQKPVEMKEISFSAEGRQLNATVRQRTTTRSTVSPNRTVFNFTLNDDTYTDRTRVVINPEASMDYEMSRDAAKFMSDDKDVPQLFTLDGYWQIFTPSTNDRWATELSP